MIFDDIKSALEYLANNPNISKVNISIGFQVRTEVDHIEVKTPLVEPEAKDKPQYRFENPREFNENHLLIASKVVKGRAFHRFIKKLCLDFRHLPGGSIECRVIVEDKSSHTLSRVNSNAHPKNLLNLLIPDLLDRGKFYRLYFNIFDNSKNLVNTVQFDYTYLL